MHLGCMRTLATASNVSEVAGGDAASLPSPAIASSPTIKGATIVIVSSSSRLELVLERQLPDTLARRGKNRVSQRGARDGGARLADAPGRFEVAHQVNFDLRRLVDPQHAKVVEIGLLDPAVLERHFAPQGAADSEDDSSLDLCLHGVGVHDHTAINRADDPMQADFARFGDRDLGDLCQVAAPRGV